MKHRILCIALACLLVFFSGCGKKTDAGNTQNPQQLPQKQSLPTAAEFETQLRRDAFPEGDMLLEGLNRIIAYSDFSITEDTVSFTLHAPYVYDVLIQWYESRDDITEDALQEKILELLDGESVQTEHVMSYSLREDGAIQLRYSQEYLNAASCGLREFYGYLYSRLLGEMEVAQDE